MREVLVMHYLLGEVGTNASLSERVMHYLGGRRRSPAGAVNAKLLNNSLINKY